MRNDIVRRLFYVYFWLLIFEGALRRWVFPGASDIILFIRDPIAICIFFLSFRLFFEKSVIKWTVPLFLFGLLGMVLTMIGGHQDWLLTLWGARIPLLHLPLIFIMPQVLIEDDFWKFQKYTFIVAIPVVFFMIFQFFMPAGHWTKIGAGGVGTADYLVAGDKTRPSSIFTFIDGLHLYYKLLGAFFFATIIDLKKNKSSLLCWLVPLWLLLGMVFSIGSRQLVFSVLILIFGFYLTSLIYKSLKYNLTLIFVSVLVLSTSVRLLWQSSEFRYAYNLTSERISDVVEREGDKGLRGEGGEGGGVVSSTLYRMRLFRIPILFEKIGFFGRGLGYKSNAAPHRISEDAFVNYILEDGEESGLIYVFYDYGMVVGLFFLLWKFAFTFNMFFISLKNIFRKKVLRD